MKLETYKPPQSSFLSIEKDFGIVMNKMLGNQRLSKLLYYATPDALSQPDLNRTQLYGLVGKQIRNIPKLAIPTEVRNYVIVGFDDFSPSGNPQFRDSLLIFDILCNFEDWSLQDLQLRPYKIAGEIDAMFNDTKLTGIGTVQFLGGSQLLLGDNLGGFTLIYSVTHGGEDRVNPITKIDKEDFQ